MDELKIIASQEISKHIPFQPEEVNIDFDIIQNSKKPNPSNSKVEVIFVALSKAIAKSYENIFDELNLNLSSIDLSTFAMIGRKLFQG